MKDAIKSNDQIYQDIFLIKYYPVHNRHSNVILHLYPTRSNHLHNLKKPLNHFILTLNSNPNKIPNRILLHKEKFRTTLDPYQVFPLHKRLLSRPPSQKSTRLIMQAKIFRVKTKINVIRIKSK